MCKIISLSDYRNKKLEKTESPNSINTDELAQLEETIWQACQSIGLDQFFINLFSGNMPEGEDEENNTKKI